MMINVEPGGRRLRRARAAPASSSNLIRLIARQGAVSQKIIQVRFVLQGVGQSAEGSRTATRAAHRATDDFTNVAFASVVHPVEPSFDASPRSRLHRSSLAVASLSPPVSASSCMSSVLERRSISAAPDARLPERLTVQVPGCSPTIDVSELAKHVRSTSSFPANPRTRVDGARTRAPGPAPPVRSLHQSGTPPPPRRSFPAGFPPGPPAPPPRP